MDFNENLKNLKDLTKAIQKVLEAKYIYKEQKIAKKNSHIKNVLFLLRV